MNLFGFYDGKWYVVLGNRDLGTDDKYVKILKGFVKVYVINIEWK